MTNFEEFFAFMTRRSFKELKFTYWKASMRQNTCEFGGIFALERHLGRLVTSIRQFVGIVCTITLTIADPRWTDTSAIRASPFVTFATVDFFRCGDLQIKDNFYIYTFAVVDFLRCGDLQLKDNFYIHHYCNWTSLDVGTCK